MHQLIKFIKNEDFAKQFLAGKLYMNSISFFWENGFEEQKDILEGVSETIDKAKFGLPIHWQQIVDGDVMFRLNAYQYCNLLCFYRVDMEDFPTVDPLMRRVSVPGSKGICLPDDSMGQFGTTVAVIADEQAFVDRVLAALPKDWLCVAGDVRYHPVTGKRSAAGGHMTFKAQGDFPAARYAQPQRLSSRRDCFNKGMYYADQREWRICLFRNCVDTGHYTLEVGDLSDIVELVPSADIQKRLMQLHFPCIPANVPPQYSGYRGNISRNGFKEKLYAFDGGMGSLLMTI